jgi:hypothetical protein
VFDFYLEWNENEQHRSMKVVLELLPVLIQKNPSQEVSARVKTTMLDALISIIARQSTKPLAKSAIKSLDYLVNKAAFSLADIHTSYVKLVPHTARQPDLVFWKVFMTELFNWVRLQYVSTIAGKFAVTIYLELRNQALNPKSESSSDYVTVDLWYQWLLELLATDSTLLETIKLYILASYFKTDRKDSIQFLRYIISLIPDINLGKELSAAALLQLAALEVGKKASLVDEPGIHMEYLC